MANDNNPVENTQEAFISFLERDFNQCFEQVRYYDAEIVDIFKFIATFYSTIATISIGLYQFATDKGVNLENAFITGLSISLLFGICMFFFMIRNRAYFVICIRYINEHRKFFLSNKPLGFENSTHMYTNPKMPPYFDSMSSQSWLMYVSALLNSIILGVIFYIAKFNFVINLVICFISFLAQLIIGIVYLKSRDNKSASVTIFGKRG